MRREGDFFGLRNGHRDRSWVRQKIESSGTLESLKNLYTRAIETKAMIHGLINEFKSSLEGHYFEGVELCNDDAPEMVYVQGG